MTTFWNLVTSHQIRSYEQEIPGLHFLGKEIFPSLGRTKPEIVRVIDVLPAPLAPIKEITSPSANFKGKHLPPQ